MAQSNVIVKLSLKDAEVVRRGLEALGYDGHHSRGVMDDDDQTLAERGEGGVDLRRFSDVLGIEQTCDRRAFDAHAQR